jgi:hypothetical protein
MKIRKLLPITLIAVVALVALSSCDDMLAGLFGLNTNNNTVAVTVNVHKNSIGVSGETAGNLLIVLTDSNYKIVSGPYSKWLLNFDTGSDPIVVPVNFAGLAAGTYYAYAWIDADGDGQPTYDADYNNYWNQSQTSITFPSGSSNPAGNIQLDVYQWAFSAGTTFTY